METPPHSPEGRREDITLSVGCLLQELTSLGVKRVHRSGTEQDWDEKEVIFPEVSRELGPNGESELPERERGREHWVGMEGASMGRVTLGEC